MSVDPTPRFDTPEALLQAPQLTVRQKLELLRRWEYDQRELAVAVEEGMPGREPELLGRIARARSALAPDASFEYGPPTKHG